MTDAECELLRLAKSGHPNDEVALDIARLKCRIEAAELGLKNTMREVLTAERVANGLPALRKQMETEERILDALKVKLEFGI